MKGSQMSIEAFARFGSNSLIEAENCMHPDWNAHVAQGALRTIAQTFSGKKEQIVQDANLTIEGKQNALKQTAKAALEEISDLRLKFLSPLQERHRQAKADFAKVGGIALDPSDIVGFHRELERRTALRELSQSERLRALKSAVENEDMDTLRAFTGAPSFAPLLHVKVVSAAEQAIVEKRHPAETAAMKDAERIAQIIEADIEDVSAGIAQEAGLQPDLRTRIEGEEE